MKKTKGRRKKRPRHELGASFAFRQATFLDHPNQERRRSAIDRGRETAGRDLAQQRGEKKSSRR